MTTRLLGLLAWSAHRGAAGGRVPQATAEHERGGRSDRRRRSTIAPADVDA